MKNYELLYVLPTSQTSEEILANFEDVRKHIEKFGGVMLETLLEHPFLTKAGMSDETKPEELKSLPLVKRKLAYPIKHEKFGFYCLVNFQADSQKLVDIDEFLRLNHAVLRHIILQADPMTTEQLEELETLFARKKAEQEKEEADKKSAELSKEETKRAPKKEEVKVEAPAEPAQEVTPAEEPAKEEEKTEPVKEETRAEEEKKAEPAQEVTPAEEPAKEEKKAKADEEKKEEKKSSRKSKIKLEELEDKLDEILEDTII